VGHFHKCGRSALAPLLLICAGCSGGSSSPSSNSKPLSTPSPDFAITLSSSSLSISQGATGAPITISVMGQNGFNSTVQVTLAGIPNGVVSNPASPFNIVTGASAPVVLGVLQNAGIGNFTITAQGTSGSLTHSATLALAVSLRRLAAGANQLRAHRRRPRPRRPARRGTPPPHRQRRREQAPFHRQSRHEPRRSVFHTGSGPLDANQHPSRQQRRHLRGRHNSLGRHHDRASRRDRHRQPEDKVTLFGPAALTPAKQRL